MFVRNDYLPFLWQNTGHFEELRAALLHCRVHRNEPHCFFKCACNNCKQTFCTYAAFKANFYRVHNVQAPSVTATAVVTDLKCAISMCECQFHTVNELLSHLQEHIVEG